MEINEYLQRLKDEGNFRSIPLETKADVVDFSTNDYIGIAGDGVSSPIRRRVTCLCRRRPRVCWPRVRLTISTSRLSCVSSIKNIAERIRRR